MTPDLIVIHEHPEWQKPLFAALETRAVRFAAYDLKCGGFAPARLPFAHPYFNQASPSRRIFDDVSANSNPRKPVGEACGFDRFARVAARLEMQIARAWRQ